MPGTRRDWEGLDGSERSVVTAAASYFPEMDDENPDGTVGGSKMMKRSCRIVGKTHQGLELRDVRIGVDVTAAVSSPRRALLNLMIVQPNV